MCRIAIFLKNLKYRKTYVDKFLLQSYTEKNTPGINNDRDFNYHKDGYGFLFLKNKEWSLYKSSLMYKDDINNKFIQNNIMDSDILIGHIRATKHHFIDDICYDNTHPFWYKEHFWMHNGSAHPLNYIFFKSYINAKYLVHIKGNTDSELLLYIFLSILDSVQDLIESWNKFLELLNEFYEYHNIVISANLVYCDNRKIIISRFINNHEEPPSLYIDYQSLIISSEPVTDNYKLVGRNTSMIVDISSKKIEII